MLNPIVLSWLPILELGESHCFGYLYRAEFIRYPETNLTLFRGGGLGKELLLKQCVPNQWGVGGCEVDWRL